MPVGRRVKAQRFSLRTLAVVTSYDARTEKDTPRHRVGYSKFIIKKKSQLHWWFQFGYCLGKFRAIGHHR